MATCDVLPRPVCAGPARLVSRAADAIAECREDGVENPPAFALLMVLAGAFELITGLCAPRCSRRGWSFPAMARGTCLAVDR